MAEYNFMDGSVYGQMVPPDTETCENKVTTRRNIVDFTKQNLDAGNGDVANCVWIPAGTTVLSAFARVITPETTNGTVDIGKDGGLEWGSGVAVDTDNSVVGNLFVPAYYDTDGYITLTATVDTADVDITLSKVEVVALCIKSLDTY